MSALGMYLWKEWREQRAALGVLAVALPAAVAGLALALPPAVMGDALAFQGVVALALLATAMSLGSDLLARERSGGSLALLERLPAGLGTAFRAKLCFYILALCAALLYGALLASCAALVKSGSLPIGVLHGTAPWILGACLAAALWVFAASAWMPAGALAFPGMLLLLTAFAWPAVLAVRGDAFFRPTPLQGLAFGVLCALGAPASAWAAFVRGSRLGRTRPRAALAGLLVAAAFFAPSWAWAAKRYASLWYAPFEIRTALVGADAGFAYLHLARRAPHGMSGAEARRWERRTELLVDLEQGTWRFPSEADASSFVIGGTAAWPAPPVGPLDFGLEAEPARFRVHHAGLGQRLDYQDGARSVVLYRQADPPRVLDAAGLPRDSVGRPLVDVRVRPGRWIARDARRWVWVDPTTGELGPLEHVGAGESVGPLLDDGRLLLAGGGAVTLLDLDSGGRTELRVLGESSFDIQSLHAGSGSPGSPLPAGAPAIVQVGSRHGMRLALLEVQAGTLRIGPPSGGSLLRLLWSRSSEAIVLEDSERMVRHDLARGERELLFSVGALR